MKWEYARIDYDNQATSNASRKGSKVTIWVNLPGEEAVNRYSLEYMGGDKWSEPSYFDAEGAETRTPQGVNSIMNELGEDGWELVNLVVTNAVAEKPTANGFNPQHVAVVANITYFFKRPKEVYDERTGSGLFVSPRS